MARDKSIRITKTDRAEYKRLASNTKAKINRTLKKYGVDLSDTIGVPKLEHFQSRESFNRWKEEAKRFTNRNVSEFQFVKNDYGVVANKKQIREIEKTTKKAQELTTHLSKVQASKPFISGTKVQGTVGQRMMQMGRPNVAGISIPKNFDFASVRTQGRLEQIAQSMRNKSNPQYYDKRMETMKNNFMNILGLSFNSDADELVSRLGKIPADIFYEIYMMFDEFDFDLYASENVGAILDENNIDKMMGYLDRYERGDIDFSLKEF